MHIETTQTHKTYTANHIYNSADPHDADAHLHQFYSPAEHRN